MRTLLLLLCITTLVVAQDSPFGKRKGKSKKGKSGASRGGNKISSSSKKPSATKGAIRSGLAYLASKQGKSGGWKSGLAATTGAVVVTSYAGLALMASGSTPSKGPYASHLTKAVDFVIKNIFAPPTMRDPKWNQTNWAVCIGGLFLAEAYAATKRGDIKNTLTKCISEIFNRMEKSGGWGHCARVKNALNYLELEVMSNWALGTLGICKKLGMRIDSSKVARAFKFIEDCCIPERGGVGYSPNRGQKGSGEAGRTGGALWLYGLHGRKGQGLYGQISQWYKKQIGGSVNGHGSIAMGSLGSALGAIQLGSATWDEFVTISFPKMLAVRRGDGSFGPVKGTGAGAVGGDNTAGANYNTALYVLVMQLDLGNLNYMGRRF